MINGITTEFGEVLVRRGPRTAADNMIGAPGEGWRLAMTVVSHEREPGELGYVARYAKTVDQLARRVRSAPERYGARAGPRPGVGHRGGRDAAAARVPAALRPPRRHLPRPRGLGRQAADDLGRAGGRPRGAGRRRRRATTAATARGSTRTSTAGPRASWAARRRSSATSSPPASWGSPRDHLRLRPARRDPGRGRRPDPDRAAQPARAAQRHQPRPPPGPGRAVPPALRGCRRPGGGAHRRRPGVLRGRRLRLHRRADQGLGAPPPDPRRTAARS